MEESEESAAEAEAQRRRGLGFVGQGGVIEFEFVEGVAQHRVVGAVDGEESGEHHRFGFPVAFERLGGRLRRRRHGVTDLRQAHVLDAGDEVADLTDAQALRRLRFG